MLIRFNGVQPVAVLELIGADFAFEPHASTLLSHIDEYASTLLLNRLQGNFKLLTTITSEGSKDIARQTLGMNTDQDRRGIGDIALRECDMGFIGFNDLAVGICAFVCVKFKFAVCGRNISGSDAPNQRLSLTTVGNQIRNCNNFQLVLCSKRQQLRHPCHGPVLVEYFTENTCRVESRHTR